jgi:hypothetical protein
MSLIIFLSSVPIDDLQIGAAGRSEIAAYAFVIQQIISSAESTQIA